MKSIFKEPLTQKANYQLPKAKTFLGIANPAYGSTLTADLRGLNFVELEPISQPVYHFTQLPETIDEVKSVATNFKDGSYKATTMLAQKNDKSKTSCCASKAKACSSDKKASANKEEKSCSESKTIQ